MSGCDETCWIPTTCPHDREMSPIGRSVPLEAYVFCDCYQDPSLNRRHLYDMHDSNRSYNDPDGWAAHEAACPWCRGQDVE